MHGARATLVSEWKKSNLTCCKNSIVKSCLGGNEGGKRRERRSECGSDDIEIWETHEASTWYVCETPCYTLHLVQDFCLLTVVV